MKALVTGATGLIGTHIVRALVKRGYDVTASVRRSSKYGSIERLPVTQFVGPLISKHLI